MYVEKPIIVFLDKLASRSPEPGGGSASALVGAVGAALVSMVGNLTLGKEKYADVQSQVEELLKSSEKLRDELQGLIQKDTEVYGDLSAVFKLPRETDAEKAERASKIQDALKKATQVPFEIAEKCLEIARLSETAAVIGNVGAVSDAGVAVLFAEAAAQSAALNVKINVNSIEDKDFSESKWARIQEILAETADLREKVVEITYSKLG
ncbi:MAG: methenyltetrahydrofolate cyclohydrolase [Candidatus Solincola sediminis]|uniref:Methenyltetrahydrofolate cyclohydrolase n=1 Tax=Candidatus Solincola sediminis TaxID=1797199 RepID=A0A1F2WH08_9ACTN|nr:MAG: methenyltetrahydrofolate cyclohydrolase [Candidatus Solincola sediminis]OFW60461.1 MAG: methenyltetrahydrofolate cyclohydrolase [Candidatus Solincola sediminis]